MLCEKIFHLVIVFLSIFMIVNNTGKFIYFLSRQDFFRPQQDASAWSLLLLDACLLGLFVLQHRAMASQAFKRFLHNIGLGPVERSIYLIATALSLSVLMWQWQPIYSVSLWLLDTSHAPLTWLLFSLLHCCAWLLLLLQSLAMDPLELLGLKQVHYYHQGWAAPLSYLPEGVQRLYSHMRHPGFSCLLVVLWLHPLLTLDRMLMALVLTKFMWHYSPISDADCTYVSSHMCIRVAYGKQYAEYHTW